MVMPSWETWTFGLEANLLWSSFSLLIFPPYLGWLVGWEPPVSEGVIFAAALPQLREGAFAGDGIAISTATRQDVTDSEV